MTHQEDVQETVDGIGVVKGADLDFGQNVQLPCSACDALVDMSSSIIVKITDVGGTESSQEMTEADARVLICSVGLPPPPVLCDQHHGWVQ